MFRFKKQCLATLLSLGMAGIAASAQAVPAEKANDARIDRLLNQMTLEEKMDLIRDGVEDPATFQGQAGYLPGVPRLHIPSLRFADGPPGVLTRVPSQAETETMGVAATFSTKDAEANGMVIGREARSLGIDVALQPFINIDRDITDARAYNTFGEDPFLTGQMGAAEVRGIQSQDVMAQAKHYVAYDSDSFNIFVGQQALHEIYLQPFADAVRAGVSSIMCSYNKVNGESACGNNDTLNTILKGELGFRGFVTSDWGGVHSVDSLAHGLDMEMPGGLPAGSPFEPLMHTYLELHPAPSRPPMKIDPVLMAAITGGTLPEEPPAAPYIDLGGAMAGTSQLTLSDALRKGIVTDAEIARAAGRVLYEMDKFGYLDGKEKHSITAQDIEANARIIQKTSEDSAILLKNDGHALPLTNSDLQSLAMLGPGAGQVDAVSLFAECSGGLVSRQIGPLDALKKDTASDTSAHIVYAVNDDMTGVPVPGALLSHDGKPGLVRTGPNGKTQIDRQINFTLANRKALTANGAWTWKGSLTCPARATTGSTCRRWATVPPCSLTGSVWAAPVRWRACCMEIQKRRRRTMCFPPRTGWIMSARLCNSLRVRTR